ncbi:hypothetical protein MTR_6g060120 [Medicago truncatula]|uniref:Uncharacterized protein n=1 Tax=Medicago truncatula TaxID=3880 RepID=G7KMX8_MEDTR|nr:hypothetical protein MTR_6g060120 [Medicago truncatula]
MPPRRQNERSLQEMEMEEMRRQIQQLQETINAQQALLEAQRIRFDDGSGSDSSSSRSIRSHRRQLRMNDIKIDIALDCVNRKVVTIFNGEIHDIFEEEKEEIQESFEGGSLGERIYDE